MTDMTRRVAFLPFGWKMRTMATTIGVILTGLTMLAADDFQSVFRVDKKTLGVEGANPYFNLTPGYTLEYRHGSSVDTITVLQETKMIDGVETRAVEHRETKNGKLAEVTRDYYAIDSLTNDVYYFGEEVDVIKNGKIVDHEGTWLSGLKGAKFGLMMPAAPQAGQKYYQELAPGVAMDRVEIVSVEEKVTTQAGIFEKCVHVRETSPLEKLLRDSKWYAPRVGQVKDGKMALIKYGAK